MHVIEINNNSIVLPVYGLQIYTQFLVTRTISSFLSIKQPFHSTREWTVGEAAPPVQDSVNPYQYGGVHQVHCQMIQCACVVCNHHLDLVISQLITHFIHNNTQNTAHDAQNNTEIYENTCSEVHVYKSYRSGS